MTQLKRIFFSAGEASGDLLGANLAKALLTKHPELKISGMGGSKMAEAGVDVVIDADKLAVVGVWEVIKHFKDIRAAINQVKQMLQQDPPDLIVLIDYPGFNLRIAKIAHEAGVKVMQYVSPQIWAWRYGRIKKIRKYIDHIALLFQFEEKIYQKENVPATFVGHPLSEVAKPTLSREAAFIEFNLDPNKPVIALFPGSRKQEVSRLLPIMMQSIPLIRKKLPNAQFVLPLASTLTREFIQPFITEDVTLVENNTYNLLSVSTAAIAASGTATLEIALAQVPMTIIYVIIPISYFIARLLINIKNIGLCNIINEDPVAKELLQHAAKPEAIAEETLKLIQDTPYREDIIQRMGNLRPKLGTGHGPEKAAEVALGLLGDIH